MEDKSPFYFKIVFNREFGTIGFWRNSSLFGFVIRCRCIDCSDRNLFGIAEGYSGRDFGELSELSIGEGLRTS